MRQVRICNDHNSNVNDDDDDDDGDDDDAYLKYLELQLPAYKFFVIFIELIAIIFSYSWYVFQFFE